MKKFKCEKCDTINNGSMFNGKTLLYIKKNKINTSFKPIERGINEEDITYICPSCNEPVKTEDLEEVI